MSTTRHILDTEENPDKYEELSEDWFSNADYDLSSSSTSFVRAAPPDYLVIKRRVYPHWETGFMKDEVFIKLPGAGKEPKAETLAGVKIVHSGRETASQSKSRSSIRGPDSTGLSAQTIEEPNNDRHDDDRTFASASAVNPHDHASVLPPRSPNRLITLNTHLPPATHFPPLDPRSPLLQQSKADADAEAPRQDIPAFGFSRLQTMVADSFSRSSVSESSILRHLAGLHNQVQGSPHTPSFWRLPFEAPLIVEGALPDAGGNVDSVSSSSTSMKASARGRGKSSLADEWPKVKARAHPLLSSMGRDFDASLHPDYDSAFSDSSEDANWCRPHRRTTSDAAMNSECTCGHKVHYVRPPRPASDHDDTATDVETDAGPDADTDDDERLDFSSYFRSATAPRIGNSIQGRNSPSDHERGRDRFRRRLSTETGSVLRNLTGSDVENKDSDHLSLFVVAPDSHSRTSSETHDPPNFLNISEDDRVLSSFSASVPRVAFPSVGNDGPDDRTADEQCDNDVHRVYFADPNPQARYSMRNFLNATRQRVSSLSIPVRERRPTLRSTISAREELEKTEQARPGKDSSKAPLGKRLFSMRGRSSTVKELEPIPATPPEASLNDTTPVEEPARCLKSVKEEGRKQKKPGILRHFFTHLGPRNKREKVAGDTTSSASANPLPSLSSEPESPRMALDIPLVAPQTEPMTWRRTEIKTVTEEDSRSEWSETVETTRLSLDQRFSAPVGRGFPVLSRRLRPASPRIPGLGRRRSMLGRE